MSTDIEDRAIDHADLLASIHGWPNENRYKAAELLRECRDLIHDLREQVRRFVEATTVGGPWDPAQIVLLRRERDALRKAADEALALLDRGQNDHDPKWPWLGSSARVLLRDALSPERSSSTAAKGETERE